MLIVIFEDMGLLSTFNIPPDTMFSFLDKLYQNYNPLNPYHNFFHATDVTQTVFLMLKKLNASDFLSNVEIFALLVAAICHDGTFRLALTLTLTLSEPPWPEQQLPHQHPIQTGGSVQ
jgi:hypothetical protein